MARSTTHASFSRAAAFALGACVLAASAPDIAGQSVPCDGDLSGTLRLPEIRTLAAKTRLREAPEPGAKVVVTLPSDIGIPLLAESDGWFLVNHRHGDVYRRLYVAAQEAERSSVANADSRQGDVQEWAHAHTRACEKVAGARFAAKSFAAATVVAGLTSIIWHLYVDDDDHYGTGFAVWGGVSFVSLVGSIYKGFALSRAKREVAILGSPSLAGDEAATGLPRADLRFDPATGRLALAAVWRP